MICFPFTFLVIKLLYQKHLHTNSHMTIANEASLGDVSRWLLLMLLSLNIRVP